MAFLKRRRSLATRKRVDLRNIAYMFVRCCSVSNLILPGSGRVGFGRARFTVDMADASCAADEAVSALDAAVTGLDTCMHTPTGQNAYLRRAADTPPTGPPPDSVDEDWNPPDYKYV